MKKYLILGVAMLGALAANAQQALWGAAPVV